METIKILPETLRMMNAASKDETRFNLNGVYSNASKIVATDGHIMAMRLKGDAEVLPENAIMELPTKALKRCDRDLETIEFTKIGDSPCGNYPDYVSTNSDVGKMSIRHDADFPDYEAIFPKGEPEFEIAIDVTLLSRLADAIIKDHNGPNKPRTVNLSFYGELAPVLVSGFGGNAVGVLMPMRKSEGDSPQAKLAKIRATK